KGYNFRWRGWTRRVVADSRQRTRHLALSINIQQAVDGRVHKAAYNFRRKTQCSGDGQQAGEQGAVVPSEMAIGAVLIFPSIAPVGAGADDGQRRVSDGRFAAGGLGQNAAIISAAEFAQTELGGGEVIDTGLQID